MSETIQKTLIPHIKGKEIRLEKETIKHPPRKDTVAFEEV